MGSQSMSICQYSWHLAIYLKCHHLTFKHFFKNKAISLFLCTGKNFSFNDIVLSSFRVCKYHRYYITNFIII